MRKVAILGASGSIGTSTIKVIETHQDLFSLVAFSVYNNIGAIETILSKFDSVEIVAVKKLDDIKDIIKKYPKVRFYEGDEGLNKVATSSASIVVAALVGFVGLAPTIAAIEAKKDIALANKETLVVAGDIVMKKAKENNVKILPVDSEHSAIFQCLEDDNKVKKIILTASGGPFFRYSKDKLKDVTIEDALNHPTWKMGAKITIDSATMFNKAFEIIEAYHLFGVSKENIEVLIHPQSVIHSMVEFEDGAIKAQLGVSDMKIPIAYALNYKKRLDNVAASLDLASLHNLEFYKADLDRFSPLKLAYKALELKGTYPAILNAANEQAVALFLDKKIRFDQIYELVEKALSGYKPDNEELTIEKIMEVDRKTRILVKEMVSA